MTLAIEATGLVKVLGDTRAVDGVDLAVRRGSVYGVLDVNPISILATASRGLTAGNASAAKIGIALGASALLTAVFAPLTVRLYRSR
jgi:ABC-2 type transport system permease protein